MGDLRLGRVVLDARRQLCGSGGSLVVDSVEEEAGVVVGWQTAGCCGIARIGCRPWGIVIRRMKA